MAEPAPRDTTKGYEVLPDPETLRMPAERLKWIRTHVLQISTHDLAALLKGRGLTKGANNKNVTECENGLAQPDVAYLRELAGLSGVPIDWILLGRIQGEASFVLHRIEVLIQQMRHSASPQGATLKRPSPEELALSTQYGEEMRATDTEERSALSGPTAQSGAGGPTFPPTHPQSGHPSSGQGGSRASRGQGRSRGDR